VSEAIELGGIRARRYAEANSELEALVPNWLSEGRVDGAKELRKDRVWLWNGITLKLFPARSGLGSKLRGSRAVRCAELHAEIAPIRSPKPILATSDAHGVSLLAYEYVEGLQLKDLWKSDQAARDSYPEFLADMHKHGVFHGDFHLDQSIWSGEHWYLLDLEGIRHSLRNIRPRNLVIGHWTRVSFDLEVHCKLTPEELRALFDRYVAAGGLAEEPDELWSAICAQVKQNRVEWEKWPLYAQENSGNKS